MTWNDFYHRRDIINSVIENAKADPDGRLPFAEIPSARREFASEQDLLLALHHKWSQLLTGQLRTELSGARDGEHSDAVTRAWHATEREHPVLRALIAANLDTTPALRAMHETDLRTIAIAAGMAEPHEPAEEITRVGAAFLALITETETPRTRRRNPMEHLLRLLAPTA